MTRGSGRQLTRLTFNPLARKSKQHQYDRVDITANCLIIYESALLLNARKWINVAFRFEMKNTPKCNGYGRGNWLQAHMG